MTSRTRRSVAALTVLASLLGGPTAATSAAPAAAPEAGESVVSEVAEARRARAARRTRPARAARRARPARGARRARPARAVRRCTGRGKARRCVLVQPAAPAPVAVPPAPAPAPAPAATPAGAGDPTAYGFLFNGPHGGGRWNPCEPIHYKVNPNRAPAGGLADLDEALRRVSEATGLRFANAGFTNDVPRSDANGSYANDTTIIAWATPAETNLLNGHSAGVGGGLATTTASGTLRIFRGFVALDATRSFRPGFGGDSQGALLMHELGHMVGLNHVGDQGQVMYPVITSATPPSWGAGDRNGLAAVGAARGCH